MKNKRLPLVIVVLALLLLVIPLYGQTKTTVSNGSDIPAITPGESISLQQALDLADKRNLSLAQVKVDILTAEAKLKASWGTLIPDVYGNLSYTFNDHADTTLNNGQLIETRARQDLDANLQVTVPLINARVWTGVSSASTGVDLSQLSAEQLMQELHFSVATAYLQALTARSLIDVYASQLEAIERHLKVADFRHRSGVGTRLDVTRSQSDRVTTKEQLIKSHYAFDNARDALAILIRADVLPMPTSTARIDELDVVNDRDLMQSTITRRYDLKISGMNLKLAKQQHLTNWMQFVPSLNASWQWSYQITDPAASQAGQDRSRWFAGLVLSVPLFDYSFYPNMKETRAAKERLRLAYQQAEDTAKLEVRTARRNYQQARRMVQTSDEKLKIARESQRLAETYYENGTGTSLDVVDARRTYQNAQVDLEIKKLEEQLGLIDLLRATGQDVETR